ncbi:hypothetical protein JOC58_001269 [Paenibacillus hunanensis]|uniref:Uncharacterized protein n=1 Tax=Paenibacillus hunanensis TaxID=539262 RepID=A0ABU1IXG4_9BACL|nr:hypothetical protein [Paenibacillus hunanensis]
MDFSKKSDCTNKKQLFLILFIALNPLITVDKSVHNIVELLLQKKYGLLQLYGQVLTSVYSAANNSHSS